VPRYGYCLSHKVKKNNANVRKIRAVIKIISKEITIMDKKIEIIEWIKEMTTQPTLFFSFHFGTPPATKDELCCRCRYIFTRLFRELLKRHWNKKYKGYFTIIGVQEHGKHNDNMHAHFLLICNDLFNHHMLKSAISKIAPKIRMDLWIEEPPLNSTKRYSDDVLVEKVYSSGVVSYTTKEIKINGHYISDAFILDTDLIY